MDTISRTEENFLRHSSKPDISLTDKGCFSPKIQKRFEQHFTIRFGPPSFPLLFLSFFFYLSFFYLSFFIFLFLSFFFLSIARKGCASYSAPFAESAAQWHFASFYISLPPRNNGRTLLTRYLVITPRR